ncbi:hypothetical protein [Brevibacillus fulvus]|uniref:C-methyltransferase domain-containing protein n=1 Tax=Brevibacillus fulvus TaxID=1125967 RepID=A0A938Y042_9BACL|nr:hypothetical protein [Brevibacillus fulvus]MBM7589596.1 hypothetical protein [Brevibacillus fulvus]
MLDEDLKILQKKIRKLHAKGCFQQKTVLLFGAATIAKTLKDCLLEHGVHVSGIIDNDPNKIGKNCLGIKVQKPEDLLKGDISNTVIVFSSLYQKEMTHQLRKLGFQDQQILNVSLKDSFSDESLPSMIRYGLHVIQGHRYYKQIRKKYSQDHKIFVCPYTGTGDVYLVGLYFYQYLRQKNINEYVFVVVNQACKKVAQIFGIQNIEIMPFKSVGKMIRARLFVDELDSLIILNDSWTAVYTNPIQWLRGHNGLNFNDMFRHFVFELPDDATFAFPQETAGEQEVLQIFEENGLTPGKTLVLSPYSNTLFELPQRLWEVIADHYREQGFSVCTNSSGPKEPPISGTTPVFFPLTQAKAFTDMAGYFIGVRSGLCDIVSQSSCKKVVFYEKDGVFFQSSTFDYFSLKHMGLSEDVLEIEYNYTDEEEAVLAEVKRYFSR